jgi:hypothetical protein
MMSYLFSNQASMTLRAIGAAVLLPPPPFSAITATAMRGFSSGAKRDKQGMIQQMSGQSPGVIALILPQGEYLSSPGFAGDPVFSADPDFVGRAALDNLHHAGNDRLPELRIANLDRRQGVAAQPRS